jgi:endonuclease
VRLIVARCSASYTGRLTTNLSEGGRLLMIKDDGTFMIWSDGGGSSVKPLNRRHTKYLQGV